MNYDKKNNIKNDKTQLAWACRRGMLELDVLLGNFLREAYDNLAEIDKQCFIKLLEHADPELIAWLVGQERPEDPDLQRIIEVIRQHAKSRL